MNTRPIADWQSPDTVPNVPKNETKQFWVAVRRKSHNEEWRKFVFDAQYVNKPLEYDKDDPDHEDEPINDDYFVDEDGAPMEAIGWHSLMEHADFDGYYTPLAFGDDYELLGWSEYLKPEFN